MDVQDTVIVKIVIRRLPTTLGIQDHDIAAADPGLAQAVADRMLSLENALSK